MDTHIKTFGSLSALNFILRILGLSHVSLWKKQLSLDPFTLRNTTVFILLSLTNVFFLIFKVQYNLKLKNYQANFTFNDTIQMMFMFAYIEYVIDICVTYKYRLERVNYFLLYVKIDLLLGSPNYTKLTNKIKKILASFIVVWFLTSLGDYLALFSVFGWQDPFLYSLEYIYMFANTMTVLDVVSILMQIECRLSILIQYLKDYYSKAVSTEVLSGDIVEQDAKEVSLNRSRAVLPGISEILFLNKSYLLLVEQVAYINRAYGVRLLIYSFTLLLNLIHHSNVIMRLGKGIFESGFELQRLPVMSTTFRLMTISAVAMLLVYWCQKNYKEDEALRFIDLMIGNENIRKETRHALKDLRVLVVTRPIRINAAGFFTCNYPLLVSITSVVGTYTIILYEKIQ